MRGITARLGGICAALFVILFNVGMFLATDTPNSDAPDADYTKYVNDSGNLMRNIIGGYATVVAAIIFLVFIAYLYKRLRAAEGGDGLLSLIVLITGVAYATCVMVGIAILVIVPAGIKLGPAPAPSPEVARWVPQAGFAVMLLAGGLSAALMSATISILVLRTKALPAWLGYFGFLAAIAMVFAVLLMPMIVFGLWLLALGIVMAMRPGSESPMPAAAAA
jgi:hypothetical protein